MPMTRVMVDSYSCDSCGDDCGAYSSGTCLGCGKVYCYDCRKTKAVKYSHAVYFEGSGDGLYCNPCNLSMAGNTIHSAYLEIASLKAELKRWGDDFKRRSDVAEKALRDLQTECEKKKEEKI